MILYWINNSVNNENDSTCISFIPDFKQLKRGRKNNKLNRVPCHSKVANFQIAASIDQQV